MFLIFNEIADIILVGGTLCVVWELVKAAKIVAAPPVEAQNILAAVKGLEHLMEKMNAQSGGVAAPQHRQASLEEDSEEEENTEIGR